MVLILVGILLSLFGDASVTLFAVGLAVVGAGTIVLAALFYSALAHVEDRDALPESDSWRCFSAPGSGTWVYPDAELGDGDPEAQPPVHESGLIAGVEHAHLQG